MAFNVVRYHHAGASHWGVVHNQCVAPLNGSWNTTRDLVLGVERAELAEAAQRAAQARSDSGPVLQLGEVQLLSPVTREQQVICQGVNYRCHMRESGIDPEKKSFNMIFRKASSSIVAAHSDVVRPRNVRLLDYEVELGLILGRDIEEPKIAEAKDLPDLLAGLVIINDYSARDVQIPELQFYKGKSYRTFGPAGPYLALLERSEWSRLGDLELRLSVNGQLRQSAHARDMVFSPAQTLTELSGVQTLQAGDLIATGTPGGCALRPPPAALQRAGALLPDHLRFKIFIAGQLRRSEYLQPGDLVEASIRTADGKLDLGQQRNRIVDAAS